MSGEQPKNEDLGSRLDELTKKVDTLGKVYMDCQRVILDRINHTQVLERIEALEKKINDGR